MIRRHEENILSWFHMPINNGSVEGLNNKAKVISLKSIWVQNGRSLHLQPLSLHELSTGSTSLAPFCEEPPPQAVARSIYIVRRLSRHRLTNAAVIRIITIKKRVRPSYPMSLLPSTKKNNRDLKRNTSFHRLCR